MDYSALKEFDKVIYTWWSLCCVSLCASHCVRLTVLRLTVLRLTVLPLLCASHSAPLTVSSSLSHLAPPNCIRVRVRVRVRVLDCSLCLALSVNDALCLWYVLGWYVLVWRGCVVDLVWCGMLWI